MLKFFCIKLHFLFYFGEPMFLVHCLEICFLYSSVIILFFSFSPVVSTPPINLLYMYSCSLSFCLCRGGSSLSSHVSQRALALRLTNVVSFSFFRNLFSMLNKWLAFSSSQSTSASLGLGTIHIWHEQIRKSNSTKLILQNQNWWKKPPLCSNGPPGMFYSVSFSWCKK